jgi:hypothetical protein
VADQAVDPWLRQESLNAIYRLTAPSRKWQDVGLGLNQDKLLARLALEDSSRGEEAARLIGRIKSRTALEEMLRSARADRLIPALQIVQDAAGGLPEYVPGRIRRRVSLDRMRTELVSSPLTLLAVLGLLVLGATLGFGGLAYLVYRLPSYMDSLRITVALVRGVFFGATFGLALFITRLLAERFSGLKVLLRILLATLGGGALLDLAIDAFHVVILNTPPQGFLIAAGSLVISLGFTLGGLTRLRLGRILISLVACFSALAGTWMVHLLLASTSTMLTPIFVFDDSTPVLQVMLWCLLAAVPITLIGNWISLNPPRR